MLCRWCFSISRGKLSPLHEASTDFQGHSSQTIIINSLLSFQLVFENDWVIVVLEVTDCSPQNYNNFHVYAQIILCMNSFLLIGVRERTKLTVLKSFYVNYEYLYIIYNISFKKGRNAVMI